MVGISCEFAGGLQALFNDKTQLSVDIPEGTNISNLILFLKANFLKRSPEMFVNDKDKLYDY
jgi:hypothetical protein